MNQTRKKKYSNIYQNILSLLLKFVLDRGYSLVARLISQMIKKVQKSKVLEVIADELECTSAEIGYLYDAIIACGPECKVEDVLDKVLKNQEN